MVAFPIQVLLGVYLGFLTGIIPAVVSWGLGFIFKYFTGVSIPAFAVVVLSLAIAGANGGLLALVDPTVSEAPNSVTLSTAIIVVLMISLYAHAKGDTMGEHIPRHLTLRRLRERTLPSDVVELVGGLGQVRVTVAGTVDDLEGYPALSEELRTAIASGEWTFPADLPVSELESRVADSIQTKHEVAEVSVEVDDQGRAHVAAAPPVGGVSKRVPRGKRAVSVRAMVPSGLTRGEEVTVHFDGERVRGTIVSARSDVPESAEAAPTATTSGGATVGEPSVAPPRSPVTDGGDGRVTIAVDRADADRLLAVERAHVVVRAQGTRREYELLSLFRRAGRRLRRLSVAQGAELVDTTIGDAAVRDTFGVGVLAVRTDDGWTLAPTGETVLEPDDELFVVGTGGDIDRFAEALA